MLLKRKESELRNESAQSRANVSDFHIPAKRKTDRQSQVMAAVLNANSEPFSSLIMRMSDAEIFPYINDMLRYIGPAVDENKGRFAQISDSGFSVVFEESCEGALLSAITMCQHISKNKNEFFDFSNFSVGISYGLVYTSPVGYGDYITPLTVSECTDLARYLQLVAPKYGAHILITESVAERIPGFFSKFNSRCLGNIIFSKSNQSEALYDVFDGDLIGQKNSKRRGKMFFETGVRLFQNKKYDQARSYFIEILKSDRDDSAAKEYLFLCDSCILGDEKSAERTNIEVW